MSPERQGRIEPVITYRFPFLGLEYRVVRVPGRGGRVLVDMCFKVKVVRPKGIDQPGCLINAFAGNFEGTDKFAAHQYANAILEDLERYTQ